MAVAEGAAVGAPLVAAGAAAGAPLVADGAVAAVPLVVKPQAALDAAKENPVLRKHFKQPANVREVFF